jgi:hypothetical protein
MHFSIRHRPKNQVPRIDGAEMVARQCGDFWTTLGPASARLVEGNSHKFNGLGWQSGIAWLRQPHCGVCRYPIMYGILARHWTRWLAAALASLFLWMGLTGLTMNGPAPIAVEIATDLGFVPACATGCFFLIAISLRFATKHSRLLDSLSTNAYGLYLVHYNFVVWLQYVLLGAALFAVIKAAIVFGGTLVLSWIAVLAVQRIPFGAQLIGAPRRAVATS